MHDVRSPPLSGGTGDFDYITFPNGVPLVQQVRVAGGQQPHSMPANVIDGGSVVSPFKVIIRENGGGGGRHNLMSSRPVSSSAMNINDNFRPTAADFRPNQQPHSFQQDVRDLIQNVF